MAGIMSTQRYRRKVILVNQSYMSSICSIFIQEIDNTPRKRPINITGFKEQIMIYYILANAGPLISCSCPIRGIGIPNTICPQTAFVNTLRYKVCAVCSIITLKILVIRVVTSTMLTKYCLLARPLSCIIAGLYSVIIKNSLIMRSRSGRFHRHSHCRSIVSSNLFY